LSSSIANAGVEQGMRDFLFSNTNMNYSSGGAYNSQKRGYYATPSVYSRNPVVEIQPVSMQLPTFRGGCGGIDMFAGSFSHINTDQFLALIKAIPSNAMGYAFSLALETISPAIADVTNQMEAIMRSINGDNLNSCEIGKSIVNSGLSKFDAGSEMVCVRGRMEKGLSKDIAQAKKDCTSGGQRSSTIAEPSNQDSAVVDTNYAWNAISKLSVDKEMKEFLQTITGTIIVKKPSDDNSSAGIQTYPSLVTGSQTIASLLYGGTMKKYTCDETVKCLNVSTSGSVSISANAGFYRKVNDTIRSISAKMNTRNQELTKEENEMLSTVQFPVISILRTYHKYSPTQTDSMITDSLSEIVAYDLLNTFIDNLLNTVKQANKTNHLQADETKLKQFEDGIETARESLRQLDFRYQKKREALLREQRNAETVEGYANKILIGNMYN
jgi:conjugative transfer pilus assembly protein TraH